MKFKLILIISIFQLVVLQSYSQTFVSQKQKIDSSGVDPVFATGERKVIIDGNNFEVDLPNRPNLKGTLKFYKEIVQKNGLKDKVYHIDGGGMIWINKDYVGISLKDFSIWFTFFLGNFVEPTDAEKIALKKLSDEKHRKNMIVIWSKMYGAFTAKCIVDKKVRPLMKETAIPLILGQPQTVNKTETANKISNQYVFNDTYVYTENGIVTVIQSKE